MIIILNDLYKPFQKIILVGGGQFNLIAVKCPEGEARGMQCGGATKRIKELVGEGYKSLIYSSQKAPLYGLILL